MRVKDEEGLTKDLKKRDLLTVAWSRHRPRSAPEIGGALQVLTVTLTLNPGAWKRRGKIAFQLIHLPSFGCK